MEKGEDLVVVLLKLPWTHTLIAIDHHCAWQTKGFSLKIASKLGPNFSSEGLLVLEVWTWHKPTLSY